MKHAGWTRPYGQALPASALATTLVYGDDLISRTQLALAGNTAQREEWQLAELRRSDRCIPC